MYIPKHFEENREEEIKRIIENFPLATLVANTKNGLVANHLPLLLNKVSKNKKVLIGHIAKTNNLHREFPFIVDHISPIFSEVFVFIVALVIVKFRPKGLISKGRI